MNFVVQVCGKLLIRKFELISLVPVPFAEEPESAAGKMIFRRAAGFHSSSSIFRQAQSYSPTMDWKKRRRTVSCISRSSGTAVFREGTH